MSKIAELIDKYTSIFRINFETEQTRMFERIKSYLAENPFVIFIKGTPNDTKCGFSEKLV